MRILAIRGENLASLGAAFEIDLASEPLAGTGLFAITGDTGAGKSTILDALCLALYGKYPRVDAPKSEGVPDPSGVVITAADARAILRRGAGTGFAEVDFVGNDGVSYRARWSVSRARGKAIGRPQNAQRLLSRVDDGSAIAEGVEPVLEAVTMRTGLSFEQFRRTVLLAQGEFDRFLLAADNERAELLEKITGTEIYAAIGKRVHTAWKERDDGVKRLEEHKQLIGSMDEVARTSLLAEIGTLETEAGAKQAEAKTVSERITRARRIIEVREQVTEAKTALEKANARSAAANPDRVRVSMLVAAEQLRMPFEAEARAAEQAQQAAAAAEHAGFALASAETAEQGARRTLAEARAADETWTTRQAALENVWREAERSDIEVAGAKVEWEKARRAVADAEKRAGKAVQSLPRQPAAAPLNRTVSEVAVEIEQLRETEREHERRKEAADARRRALEAEGATLEDELAMLAAPALEARDRELVSCETLLHEAGPLAEARAQLELDNATALDNARTAVTTVSESTRAIEIEEKKRADLAAKRAEISGLVALADATQSREAIALRETLVPEKPCPVCGGNEHPYAAPDHADSPLVAEIRKRRQALDADIAVVDSTLKALSARKAGAEAELAHATRAEAAAAKSSETLSARLRALDARLTGADPKTTGIAELHGVRPLDGATAESLDAALGAIAILRRALAAPLQRVKSLGEAITVCNRELQKLGAGLELTHLAQSLITALLAAGAREMAWRDHARERASLLDGDPVAENRARFTTGRTAAQSMLKSAETAMFAAAQSRTAAATRTTETAQQAGVAERERAKASQNLVIQAEAAALDLDEARVLLAVPADQREDLGKHLDALSRDIRNAEIALETRQRDLDDLLATDAGNGPVDSADEDQATISTLTASASALQIEIDQLHTRRGERSERLTQDDEARMRAAGMAAEIDAAKAQFIIWDQVHAAIGDAEGGKFRRFAQGVTLEELIRLANRQLDQLAPRYRLAKGATSDLALSIVDRDMGDEQRSVRSLSGGERFLMSLALALALSGLEGRQSFVDTLFIDEGFGTLDAETLDIVIEALERLQGSGRKVGVITHVAAMVERIAVQVRVEPRGAGRSVVRTIDRANDALPLAS